MYSLELNEGSVLFDRFVIQEPLGRGGYGFVFKALDSKDGTQVALKISHGTGSAFERNMCEAQILELFKKKRSPYSRLVVHMKTWFHSDDGVVLVLELLSHDLRKSISKKTFNSFKIISNYAKQMIDFLVFASGANVIHGDIKPENILVQEGEHRIKFADFGLSSCLQFGPKPPAIQSLFYRSPEVLLGYDYGKAVDIWSVGCVLLECLLGFVVFNVEDELELMQMIVELIGMPPDEIIENAPDKDDYFVYDEKYKQWLVHGFASPVEPIGIKNFIKRNHPGNVDSHQCLAFVELIEGILIFNPQDRLTPEDCLRLDFLWL